MTTPSNNNGTTVQSSTLDGLPKQFVIAMRTLFDIMDDKKTGLVNFADIENRWQDDGSKGLPRGVIESLRKVTPPNGLLTFERFCAGLKICLLRNQVERRNDSSSNNNNNNKAETIKPNNRPPSAPLLDIDHAIPKQLPAAWTTNNTATIRPNNIMCPQNRTISMPQLVIEPSIAVSSTSTSSDNNNVSNNGSNKPSGVVSINSKQPALFGPPKPPRSGIVGMESGQQPMRIPTGNMDRAEIRTALQNWQMGILLNDQEIKNEKRNGNQQQFNCGLLRPTGRSLGDGKAATTQNDAAPPSGIYQKKPNARRREPRRHTLQNGIDYNMLKRMKQVEQEKDVLMTGLGVVEKTRDWYLKQVAAVQEKMKYLGRMGHVETWSEAQQERLELRRARVLEVNRHLEALTDSWERGGLPLHMNLAVHHYPPPQDLSDRLKTQNRLLTEEVGKKSERIAALEREKASLIQMLQMRTAPNTVSTRNNIGQEEAVF